MKRLVALLIPSILLAACSSPAAPRGPDAAAKAANAKKTLQAASKAPATANANGRLATN